MTKLAENNPQGTANITDDRVLANRLYFRAWIENGNYMAIQSEPDLETLQSFMFHYGNQKNIMQYTGIDDINSLKIYEGDIVKFTRHYGNWQTPSRYGIITDICEIIFDYECCRFALKYKSNIQKLRKHHDYKYEIIGNIFETRDLLQAVL